MSPQGRLLAVYETLLAAYGSQHWWPADSPFEVMVGAVLTQNTAWKNVSQAIDNLRGAGHLGPEAVLALPAEQLARLLRPSGYFNIKARRLRNLCAWYLDQGGHDALVTMDTETLRRGLLSVNGIGPETADDILLYAFDRPVFVIDAYTRRLFARLAVIDGHEGYEALRRRFESGLPAETQVCNEYHALIVRHAKDVCRKRACVRGAVWPTFARQAPRCEAGSLPGRG